MLNWLTVLFVITFENTRKYKCKHCNYDFTGIKTLLLHIFRPNFWKQTWTWTWAEF